MAVVVEVVRVIVYVRHFYWIWIKLEEYRILFLLDFYLSRALYGLVSSVL